MIKLVVTTIWQHGYTSSITS